MATHNSTRPVPASKPKKPSPDFPLTPHPNGRWCKKVKGKLYYFGRWADPNGALAEYLGQRERIETGATTADNPDALTVYILCGKFLTLKKGLVANGELSPHTLTSYADTCKALIKKFGRNRLVSTIGPGDFERYRMAVAKRWGFHRIANEVTRVRTVFKYAAENGMLEKPVLFGQSFKRPSRKVMRKHRAEQGPKMFEATEIRALLERAGPALKAMILLGVNGGFGNSDVGALPMKALDLDNGWCNFARVKTGIARKIPLWPETVEALRSWLAVRPLPTKDEHAEMVFVTAFGGTWAKTGPDSPVSKEFRKVADKCDINGHRGFYCLRHTFQTVGDNETRDFVGVKRIMGHAMDEDISDTYREKISDERLRTVTDAVRSWLFGKPAQKKQPARTQRAKKPQLRIVSA